MTTTIDLQTIKDEVEENLEKLLEIAKEDSEIDELDLDAEALRISNLHGKWLAFYSDHKKAATSLNSYSKKIYLERWKYYSGKQTDEYYAANGFLHEKILKTDLDKYLDSDSILIMIKHCVAVQYQILDVAEKMLKELHSRGFNIKNAIEWRKFQAGV